jgi:predicted metal-dependent peptidase
MNYTPVTLTTAQARMWEETRAALAWCCPGFTHIFQSMLNNTGQKTLALFTEDLPAPAATNGTSVIINPEMFFSKDLNLMNRVFIMAHEIAHCIWDHCGLNWHYHTVGKVTFPDGTSLPYNHKIMNIAEDLVINDMLIVSSKEPGQSCGEFPEGKYKGMWDTNLATKDDSVIDAYRKVYEEAKQNGNQPGNDPGGGGGGHGGFDQHLKPGDGEGKDPQQAVNDRNPGEWEAATAAAANAARLQGKLPAALDRWFKELLAPKVDWREQIRALFSRRVGSGAWDWAKPDRRLIVRDIYAPGRSGHGVGTVVVGVDTSGSISQNDLAMFAAEMAGILEDCRPKRVVAIMCDAQVQDTQEMDEAGDVADWGQRGLKGGGGTSFIPVFEWIAEEGIEPDALVYLTDGLGAFPHEAPSYPVIWGNIYPDSKYPFGDVVQIPKQA